jgi:hypothetical protein
MDDKVSMQDLESCLNVMIRSEIPHMRLISDEKLTALKEWMRILAKVIFFLSSYLVPLKSFGFRKLSGHLYCKRFS